MIRYKLEKDKKFHLILSKYISKLILDKILLNILILAIVAYENNKKYKMSQFQNILIFYIFLVILCTYPASECPVFLVSIIFFVEEMRQ